MKTRQLKYDSIDMDYNQMTHEEFNEILSDIVYEQFTDDHESFLRIPGLYEILSEYFHNEVLDHWASDQPKPEDDEVDDRLSPANDFPSHLRGDRT